MATLSLLILCLCNCAGTVVTKQNALAQCPYFNVQCKSINEAPEFPIKVVGNKVSLFCDGNKNGCVTNKTIFLKEKDWMVLGHERCHNYCGDSHFKKRIVLASILKSADVN